MELSLLGNIPGFDFTMFKRRNIVSAIDIGTSKICVLVGCSENDEPLSVIGRGEVSLNGEVVKGEIADMEKVFEKFSTALDLADESCGGELNNAVLTAMSITGCNIGSFQTSAPTFINSNEGRVSMADIEAAYAAIEQKPLPGNQKLLNTVDSYYLLDSVRRVRNPLDQAAQKFELFCHVIYGDATRIDNFTSLYRNVGFEDQPVLLFSGMADLYGIISPEEREHGVLAVDMGRGTTEYIAIFNDGVFASGVVPVGFDHVANDLAIGLGLPIETARDILASSTIPQAVTSGSGIIQIKHGSQSRRIPLASFEKIIDLRLRELFTIIKNSFEDRNVLRNLARGGVITGGGALFPRTVEMFQQTFEFPVRTGYPYDVEHNLGELANPRYSTVWGTLKFAEEQLKLMLQNRRQGMWATLSGAVGNVGESAWRTLAGLKNSIKI